MKPKTIIGLMSGSSLDGLDIACCKFEYEIRDNKFQLIKYQVIAADEYNFPIEILTNLRQWRTLNIDKLLKLDAHLGVWMGKSVQDMISSYQIQVELISSHGHTLLHQPEDGYSWQIGHAAHIAAETNLPVVFDFRNQDIARGGQGAPMVPIAERFLWPEHSLFLNLGGIANISWHNSDSIVAWDSCACNQVLNALSAVLGMAYDSEGTFARKGRFIPELYERLISSKYHLKTYPKSLDNTYVQNQFTKEILAYQASIEDKLYTTVRYICQAIYTDLTAIKFPDNTQLMITGGGTFNTFLIETLRSSLAPINIELYIPNEETIRFKEAIMIAFCGLLRYENEVNFIKSVTGAERDSIGGSITY
jgi:anhydro-N-acetylmuramic acid kinase